MGLRRYSKNIDKILRNNGFLDVYKNLQDFFPLL